MTANQLERPTGSGRRTGGWLGRAWLAVVLIPVFFFVSFAVSYLLYDVFGYAPEDDNAPLWVELVVALVALAIVLVPCVVAVTYGRRAARDGDRRGLGPLGLGALAGAAITVLTVVTTIADALR